MATTRTEIDLAVLDDLLRGEMSAIEAYRQASQPQPVIKSRVAATI
jgi:hypothetical protein